MSLAALAPLPQPAASPAVVSFGAAPAGNAGTEDLFAALVARLSGDAAGVLPLPTAGTVIEGAVPSDVVVATASAEETPDTDAPDADEAVDEAALLDLLARLGLPAEQQAALIAQLQGRPVEDPVALETALQAVEGALGGGKLPAADLALLRDALSQLEPRTEPQAIAAEDDAPDGPIILPEKAATAAGEPQTPTEKPNKIAAAEQPQPVAVPLAEAPRAAAPPAARTTEAAPLATITAEAGTGASSTKGDEAGRGQTDTSAAGLPVAPGPAPRSIAGTDAVANFTAALNAARSQPAHPAVEAVAVRLAKAAGDAPDRLTVQLRPAELGTVEIRLDLGKDGQVSAAILADRSDTLQMLQRDRAFLERALGAAGFAGDGATLNFGLRQGQGQGQQQNQPQRNPANGTGFAGLDGVTGADAAAGQTLWLDSRVIGSGRINVRI